MSLCLKWICLHTFLSASLLAQDFEETSLLALEDYPEVNIQALSLDPHGDLFAYDRRSIYRVDHGKLHPITQIVDGSIGNICATARYLIVSTQASTYLYDREELQWEEYLGLRDLQDCGSDDEFSYITASDGLYHTARYGMHRPERLTTAFAGHRLCEWRGKVYIAGARGLHVIESPEEIVPLLPDPATEVYPSSRGLVLYHDGNLSLWDGSERRMLLQDMDLENVMVIGDYVLISAARTLYLLDLSSPEIALRTTDDLIVPAYSEQSISEEKFTVVLGEDISVWRSTGRIESALLDRDTLMHLSDGWVIYRKSGEQSAIMDLTSNRVLVHVPEDVTSIAGSTDTLYVASRGRGVLLLSDDLTTRWMQPTADAVESLTYAPDGLIIETAAAVIMAAKQDGHRVDTMMKASADVYQHQGRLYHMSGDSLLSVSATGETLLAAGVGDLFCECEDELYYVQGEQLIAASGTYSLTAPAALIRQMYCTQSSLLLRSDSSLWAFSEGRFSHIESLSHDVTVHADRNDSDVLIRRGNQLHRLHLPVAMSLDSPQLRIESEDARLYRRSSSVYDIDCASSCDISVLPTTLYRQGRSQIRSRAAGGSWSSWSYDDKIILATADLQSGVEVQLRSAAGQLSQSVKLHDLGNQADSSGYGILAAVVAALLGALVIAIVVLRRRERQQSMASRTHRRRLQQQRIAELEQKSLQLQMNPHFIFNTLQSIRSQVAQGDPARSDQLITQSSRLMRATLDHSRSELISLESEIAYLRSYLDLERGLRSAFSYEITGDELLDESALVMVPPLLLQPFVENSIVHGLSGLDRPGQLTLHFTDQQDHVLVCIADNGRGRAAAQARRDLKHTSHAMDIIADRLSRHSAEPIRYEDLYDDQGKPIGTRVWVKLPILEP